MTVRIYTIPANKVSEGMHLHTAIGVFPVIAIRIETNIAGDDGRAFAVRVPGWGFDMSVWAPADKDVEVTLPGPSPRELLCSCTPRTEHHCTPVGCMDVEAKPAMDWRVHLRDCPVHRLRLRLWPVGATWEPRHGSKWPGVWRIGSYRVDPDAVGDLRADLRAAFCEQEVQP